MSFFAYPDADEDGGAEQLSFLASATEADWAALRAHCELLTIPAGQLVIPQGANDRALYIVVSGSLEVTVPRNRRGGERQLTLIEPGTVIGELGFFDGLPRSANVRATSDAVLLRLGYQSFEVLAAKEPALGRRILLDMGRVLATRLRKAEARAAAVRP